MKILLIYVITENVNLPVMPLGMACVAASVQNAGHTVKSVSMSPEVIAPMIGAAMSDFAPDIIGISVRNIDDQKMRNPVFLLDPVKSAVSCCRRLSTAPIVLGGAGYSIFPESVLRFTGADMGIQGEGESAFPALIYRISRHEPIQDIAGLWLSGQTPLSAKRVPERLDAHPMAPVDLLKSLSTGLEKQDFWLPYQTRRGCPMKCSYCSTPQIEGELLRQKPIDRVIRELEGYAAAGFRRIFFVDNTF
ncbi:MAG: cobalamin-dependent protein, partial [Desulfobacterales bacterium]|nr:cobalamin-dependent protein [Desulfobacterales bacterium]